VTEHVVRQVSGERAGDLAAVVDRHRRMMTSGPAGGGPDVWLALLGSDLDLRAWVLSPAGRLIAAPKETSPAAGPAGGTGLPADVCARLAAEHLAAGRSGRRGPHRVTLGATTYSLFPVRSTGRAPESGRGGKDAPAPAEGALADWVLAVEADAGAHGPPPPGAGGAGAGADRCRPGRDRRPAAGGGPGAAAGPRRGTALAGGGRPGGLGRRRGGRRSAGPVAAGGDPRRPGRDGARALRPHRGRPHRRRGDRPRAAAHARHGRARGVRGGHP